MDSTKAIAAISQVVRSARDLLFPKPNQPGYFQQLANRAGIAVSEDQATLTRAVAQVLSDSGKGSVDAVESHLKNTSRDDLQDQIAAALVLPADIDARPLAQRIQETATYAARIGLLQSTQWEEEVGRVLGSAFERDLSTIPTQPQQVPSAEQLESLRNDWRILLQEDLGAQGERLGDVPSEAPPPLPPLGRRTAKVAGLIRSYAPVIARQTAAAFNRKKQVQEAFKQYGFDVHNSVPSVKELESYLDGSKRPPNLKPTFKHWPTPAIGGSFAARLATDLDYPPSAWVLEIELKRIDSRRKMNGIESSASNQSSAKVGRSASPNDNQDPRDAAWRREFIGLAFSGGGIRSATFNLGVLQGLAKLRMLRSVDYLSTVSGGGYIGSWLINWIRHEDGEGTNGLDEVEHRLSPSVTPDPDDSRVRPVRALRDFSNYLTPRLGLLRADVWVMVILWVRNTLLNLLVLLPTLIAVLLLPRLLDVWVEAIQASSTIGLKSHFWSNSSSDVMIAVYIFGVAASLIALNLADCPRAEGDGAVTDSTVPRRFYVRLGYIRAMVILIIFPAAWLMAIGFWSSDRSTKIQIGSPLLFAAFVSVIFVVATGYLKHYLELTQDPSLWSKWVKGITLCILVLVALCNVVTLLAMTLQHVFRLWPHNEAGVKMMTVWGVPLVVLAILLFLFLLVGILGRNLADSASNWVTRLCAHLAIYTLIWTVWVGLAIYGTDIDRTLFTWSAHHVPPGSAGWAAAVVWAWTTARSVLAGKSAQTNGNAPGSWTTALGFYATVGPYVFIVGLMLGLAFVSEQLFHYAAFHLPQPLSSHKFLGGAFGTFLQTHPWSMGALACFVLSVVSAMALSYCVDINEFSMNRFYRNRLIRCYVGASNKRRQPNLFTGFDAADDEYPLASFTGEQWKGKQKQSKPYTGPYPIYNTTLNLVYGDELAWQERRRASFIFTPDVCGYETPWRASNNPGAFSNLQYIGYRNTGDYAYGPLGVHLGTPASISGAAVSPNMGFYSKPATAFLMTIFDARLGWWLGNPRHETTWQQAGPKLGLVYLVKELLGMTNDRAAFVYLSDGGHFENLGIYELVRRRCRYIIACDSEEDASLAFHGLGNAIRKCREDFGVEIKLQVSNIQPDPVTKLSRTHCVLGTIQYPDQPGLGYLVYLKATIVGDEPEDILEYKRAHSSFPHQTTANQWFNESQFESYRRLGQHIALTAFHRAVEDAPKNLAEFCSAVKSEFFREMQDNWYPTNPSVTLNFTRHTAAYDALIREIRSDGDLLELETILFPTAAPVINDGENKTAQRAGKLKKDVLAHKEHKAFLYCVSLIQLMENVYTDLDLESTFNDPHNAGWVSIFRQWAKASVLQSAWRRCGWTYGRTFRRFCHRRLGLPLLDGEQQS